MNTLRDLELLQRMATQVGKGNSQGKSPATETEKKARALAAEASMFLKPVQRSQKQLNRPRMSSAVVNVKMFV